MQFRDLKQQYQVLKKDIDAAMVEVATNCNFISGAQVTQLEKELAEYVGVKHCVTCANGTDALSIAMMAWGIKEGDAVFVPDFTFFASGEIVSHCGATPIFVDVDKDTFNVCSESLETAIKKVLEEGKLTPKVVIAVDLFGLPADFAKVKEVADKYGLLVLEDGAQGFGGEINGKRACSFGDISTTSFFPAKPLGCYGDGGAIFTNDDTLAAQMRAIANHGMVIRYHHDTVGVNSRLDSIQAAVLDAKLPHLDAYIASRQRAAAYYDKAFANHPNILIPVRDTKSTHVFHQYTLRLVDVNRDALREALAEKGIPAMIYYPIPLHMQKAYQDPRYKEGDFPVAEKLAACVLSLPMHTELDDEQLAYITQNLLAAIANCK